MILCLLNTVQPVFLKLLLMSILPPIWHVSEVRLQVVEIAARQSGGAPPSPPAHTSL